MFKDKEKLYQIYHTVLSLALTWAVVLVLNHYLSLNVPVFGTLFYSFVPALVIYLVDINKKNAITYLLLGSIIPIIALIFWITKTNPVTWLKGLVSWCSAYDGSEALYMARYAHVVIFGIALAAAVFFYILTGRQVAKVVLAVVLLAVMIIFSISQMEINKAVVGIAIFYILTVIVELYGIIYSRKAGKQEKKEGILYLAPICLLLAILAIAFPSKPEPLQWKAVKYVYNNVKEQIEVWRTELNYYFGNARSEFFVSLTGYSEDNGELQSETNLIKDNKVAMKISGLDKGKSAYLIGSVSDIYTGTSWEKSREDYVPEQKEYFLDYVEMFYALSRQEMIVLDNNRFLERKTLRVEYNNIKTKTFFYPIMMSSYDIFTRYKKITTHTPQINFVKARGKGTSYQLIYYELNLEGDAFKNMLRKADTFSYDNNPVLNQETADYVQNTMLNQDDVEDLLQTDYYGLLKDRSEMIKERYTALPDTLPDRVYDLAEEITKGYNNKYDKLKAIETYLLTNYTYSLDAQKLPEGSDFMDYFLFESRKGYCTSFASAFAVLGRCIGIPTRYVEGFLGNCKTRDENYNYLIKNSQAHAWGEAYIEGIGWIPFEATAPFFNNRYSQWAELPKQGTVDLSIGSGYQPEINDDSSKPFQPEEEIVEVEKDNMKEIVSGIIISISTLLILLLLLIIYYYVMRYRYKKSFGKADNNQKMYMLFLRILNLLKREGFSLDQQETILMLSDRVKEEFCFGQISFSEIAGIFMRYRYADENVNEEELRQVTIYHEGLKEKQKQEDSRLKVWFEEFLFLTRKGNY